jgi:hypothetical protein
MKRQIFEGPPTKDLLIAQLDLLKYENAFLRKSVNSLQDRIEVLKESEARYIEKLELQQEHIDRLTADCLKK